MKSPTRREMVLEIYDREAMGEVTAREIGVIQSGLIETFGEGGTMTPAEIARVLLDEDLPVRLDQVFAMPGPLDAYEELFSGRASPTTLAEAEETIAFFDEQRRRFSAAGDRTGLRLTRETAQRSRQNALALAASPARAREAREIGDEIARWLTVWLQTPEIFPVWLELRKRALDIRKSSGE